ncbi:hypothetical protein LTR62_004202 [Meristemomyces frigidus]|uniref:endo-1,3(4)-beta-glucanase n=1 Tax=Meristemomyces frigidus TaxID=1508187 RepID=A0AAN7TFG2_9PEZI|nr:hypothetical protein LTR62_004202 [Meristemomyces frigidus]
MSFFTLATCILALGTTGWAQYVLTDDYLAEGSFFNKFAFWDTSDPTHGFVDYQTQGNASDQQLISSSSTNVRLGVDSTNIQTNGRPSVRLTSTKSYSSGLFILDADHMPFGCGTWPAFWLVGPDWPAGGEIDIIEGVNEQTSNDMTLHTSDGCSITNNEKFTGSITTPDCYVDAAGQPNNAGCQIGTTNTQTYGAGFNANKGGVYATEWTSSAISIYFFPRGSIPADITSGWPNPSGWGEPLAQFQGGCDIPSFFSDQQIVFDTTFCGDWAGNVWSSGSCAPKASTCDAFVANNPAAFTEAYWSINALKVYQKGGAAPSGYSSVAPSSAHSTPQSLASTSTSSTWASSWASSTQQTTFATSSWAAASTVSTASTSVGVASSSWGPPVGPPGRPPMHTKFVTGNDTLPLNATGSGAKTGPAIYPSATGLIRSAPAVSSSYTISIAAVSASTVSSASTAVSASAAISASTASSTTAPYAFTTAAPGETYYPIVSSDGTVMETTEPEDLSSPPSSVSVAAASSPTDTPETSAITIASPTTSETIGPDFYGWQSHSWSGHHHHATQAAAVKRHIQRHNRRHGAGVF